MTANRNCFLVIGIGLILVVTPTQKVAAQDTLKLPVSVSVYRYVKDNAGKFNDQSLDSYINREKKNSKILRASGIVLVIISFSTVAATDKDFKEKAGALDVVPILAVGYSFWRKKLMQKKAIIRYNELRALNNNPSRTSPQK